MSSLPDPHVLQAYEAVQPGFSSALLLMAQKEQRFRHLTTYTGQILGLIIALSFLAASTYLVSTGHDVAGSVLGTVDIVALVTIFVAGRGTSERKSIKGVGALASSGLE
jgi:uncharacterized membrane protein